MAAGGIIQGVLSIASLYSEKVLEHFRNPKNLGEIPDADIKETVGNPVCGDMMTVYVKIEGNRIKDVKFQTFGCVSAIATSDVLADMVKGKTIEEALKITSRDVAEELGGLPKVKLHCSSLAAEALHKGLKKYLEKHSSQKDGG